MGRWERPGVSVMRRVIFLVLLPAVCVQPALAIVGGAEPAAGELRFDAIGAFSQSKWLGLDPLEPNAQDHNWFGAAVLIAPDVILTVDSLIPDPLNPPAAGDYAVRFRRQTDGSIGSKASTPDTFYHERIMSWVVPTSGAPLIMGILENPVTHIDPIKVDLAHTLAITDTVTIGGWGREGPAPNTGPREKLKTVDKALTDVADDKLKFDSIFLSADGPNMFDSGGAVLEMELDGTPRLVGLVTTWNAAADLAQFDGDVQFVIPQYDKLPGDVNLDGFVDDQDIDLVLENIQFGPTDITYDLNDDLLVDDADADMLIYDILNTVPGDTNLDGTVDLADYDDLSGNYTGTLPPGTGGKGWAQGDFKGDRDVSFEDFVTLALHFGFVAETITEPIPEPGTAACIAAPGIVLVLARRRRGRR